MKPSRLFLFLIFLSFLLWGAFIFPVRAETQLLDQVVAVVNDEVITQSELDTLLRPFYEQYKKEYKGEPLIQMLNEARRKLLNQLIEDRLVFQEATTQKIEVHEEEVEEQLEEFRARFKDPKKLEEALKKEGLTMTEMRERLRRQIMVRRLHDMEIRSKIVVSPLEVEEYYRLHPEEFSKQDRIKVRSMTLRKSEEAREKGLTDESAKHKIEDLQNKVLKGENFADLAAQHSEDSHTKNSGIGDWVERGAMIPAIDDAIFKLKADEVSEIIETPMGYHFFRVEERELGTKQTLEQARDAIFSKIFQQKGRERFKEWLLELKRNAYISLR